MDPYHYPQYRNPPVPGPERDHYRDAFLRGYDEGMHRARGWDQDRDNYWRDHDRDPTTIMITISTLANGNMQAKREPSGSCFVLRIDTS